MRSPTWALVLRRCPILIHPVSRPVLQETNDDLRKRQVTIPAVCTPSSSGEYFAWQGAKALKAEIELRWPDLKEVEVEAVAEARRGIWGGRSGGMYVLILASFLPLRCHGCMM